VYKIGLSVHTHPHPHPSIIWKTTKYLSM